MRYIISVYVLAFAYGPYMQGSPYYWRGRHRPNMFAVTNDPDGRNRIVAQYLRSPGATDIDEVWDDEMQMNDVCYERKCSSNEHCCPGWICMSNKNTVGTCIRPYGKTIGKHCRWTNECEPGLICEMSDEGFSICQTRSEGKGYNERCQQSNECDIKHGLCCQVVRGHRQAPRKVCQYFTDPLTCVGSVNVDLIEDIPSDNTYGEKRIAFQPIDLL